MSTIGMKKDASGRWVSTGGTTAESEQPQQRPPAPPPRRVAAPPRAKAPAPPWWSGVFALGRLANDARYEAKRFRSMGPIGYAGRVARNLAQETLISRPGGRTSPAAALLSAAMPMVPAPARRQLALTTVGVADNAARLGEALIQRQVLRKPKADGSTTTAQVLDILVDSAYKQLGAIPPSEMSPADFEKDQARRNLGVMAVQALPVGRAIGGASTLAGSILKGGATFAITEALGTYLSDNRAGNIVNLVNGLAGTKLPGAVGPDDDWIDAANSSLVPNAVSSALLGGTIGAGVGALRFTAKAVRNRRAVARVTRNRAALENAGLTKPDPETGTSTFTPEAVAPPSKTWDEAANKVQNWIESTKAALQAKQAAENPAVAQATQAAPAPVEATPPAAAQAPAPPADAPALPMVPPPRPAREITVPTQPAQPQQPQAPQPRWGPDGTARRQAAMGDGRTTAVPEPSPLQEYLRMRYGSTGPSIGAMEASPVQQALGIKELQASPDAMGLEAGPGRMAPAAVFDASKVEAGPARFGGTSEPTSRPADTEPGPQADAEATGMDAELGLEEPPIYDAEIPEADVALGAIRQLSDEELVALSQQQGPVLDAIEQMAASRPEPEPGAGPNSMLRADLSMAPAGSLSEQITGGYEGFLRSMGEAQLRDLTNPELNPELSRAVQANAGKPWEELDFEDLVDGLSAWSSGTGEVVVPRDYGQQFLPVAEINVDPVRFQFKGGVDADGVQKGNSLEGVSKWDPAFEGIVDVWRDPADGKVWVVNGHNRVAKARALGIGSLPVRYMVAKDASMARAQGAAANIASGSGTEFDAGKFFRELGITSRQQAEALGSPLSSGKTEAGLSLARLPADMFRDAVDGLLPLERALAIGRANLDEATMRALYGMLKKNPDMSAGTFSQLVQMGQGLLEASPRAAGPGAQPTLPGMEEALSDLVPKATLLNAIETELGRQRTVMSRTAREAGRLTQVGNQIDVGSTREAGQQARDLLDVFRRDKLMVGPLADLLNEGTAEVAGGAKVKPVADRIIQQFKALVEGGGEAATALNPEVLPPQRRRRGTPISDGLAADLNELGGVLGRHMRGLDEHMQGQAKRLQQREGDLQQRIGEAASEFSPEEQEIIDGLEGIAQSLRESSRTNAEMAERGFLELAEIRDMDGGPVTGKVVPSPRPRQGGEFDPLPQAPESPAVAAAKRLYQRMEEQAKLTPEEAAAMPDGIFVVDPVGVKPYKLQRLARAVKEADPELAADYRAAAALTREEGQALLAAEKSPNPYLRLEDVAATRQAEIARQAAEKPSLVETTLPEELRQELQDAALQRAIVQGEVRPPETPIPDLPEPPALDLETATRALEAADGAIEPGTPAAQALADELRLAAEQIKQDAAIDWEAEKVARDAADEELLTFDQKKSMGLLGDFEPEVMETTPMPRESKTPLADAFGGLLRQMAESDARLFRELGEFTGEVRKQIDDLAGMDAPAKPAAKGLPASPASLGAAPAVKLTPAQVDLLQRVGTQRGFRLYPGDGERARASGGQLASSIQNGALAPSLARYEASQLRSALSEGWIKSKAQQKQLDGIATKLEKAADVAEGPVGEARAQVAADKLMFEQAAAEARRRGDEASAARFEGFANADAPGRPRETLPDQYDLDEAVRYLAGQAPAAPELAPAPVKPEPVKLVDEVVIEPERVGAKLTPAQENAIFSLTKQLDGVDGRALLAALRDGRLSTTEARQLVDAAKAVEKPPATLRRAVAKLEEALGVPGAVKARNTDIQAEIRANEDQAAEIRRKATEDGC